MLHNTTLTAAAVFTATTASTASAAPLPAVSMAGSVVTSRERRRRAPATGAADDCFACRKLDLKCDRRRPYCGQCLGQDKDCSGYKTQLTWGVGVASRGKLRGQALPVPQTMKKSPTIPTRRSRQTSSSASPAGSVELSRSPSERSTEGSVQSQQSKTPPAPMASLALADFDFNSLGITRSTSSMIPPPHHQYSSPWAERQMGSPDGRAGTLYGHRRSIPPPLPVYTPLESSFDDYAFPPSAGSATAYSQSDLGSLMDYPPTTPEVASYLFPSVPMYDDTLPSPSGILVSPPQTVTAEYRTPISYPDPYLAGASDSSPNLDLVQGQDQTGFYPMDFHKPRPTTPLGLSSLADLLFEDDPSSGGLTFAARGIHLGYEYVDLLRPFHMWSCVFWLIVALSG